MITGCPSETKSSASAIKLPESKVNRTLMEKAASFASRVLRGWKEGDYNRIKAEETTPGLISALPPETQKTIYEEQIKPIYGSFDHLAYKETYMANGNHIFRFRGAFEKGIPEVRVVVTPEGLITGFWIRPWSDKI